MRVNIRSDAMRKRGKKKISKRLAKRAIKLTLAMMLHDDRSTRALYTNALLFILLQLFGAGPGGLPAELLKPVIRAARCGYGPLSDNAFDVLERIWSRMCAEGDGERAVMQLLPCFKDGNSALSEAACRSLSGIWHSAPELVRREMEGLQADGTQPPHVRDNARVILGMMDVRKRLSTGEPKSPSCASASARLRNR